MNRDEALAIQEMLRTRGGKLLLERLKRNYETSVEQMLVAPPGELAAVAGQTRAFKAQLTYLATAQSLTDTK